MQSVNEILTEWAAGTEHTAVQGLITTCSLTARKRRSSFWTSKPGVEPCKRSWNDNTRLTRAFKQEALNRMTVRAEVLYADEKGITPPVWMLKFRPSEKDIARS